MWHRISGKSKHSTDDLPPQSSRRKGDESRSDECVRKESTPTSTSYSSTLPRQYPGAATASIASSYATVSGNNNKKPYIPPGLVRNASLVCDNDRYRGDRKRDKKNLSRGPDGSDDNGEMIIKSEKNGKDGFEDRGSRSSGTRISERIDTSRGPADFPDQATSASYSQSPGQYNGAILSFNGDSVDRMSSHIQDHFPSKSSAPYLPPLAASQGGPGLAAEYYGDNGQSVADQPGNRTNTPSLIIGAEPHLQPASSAAHPPPEPSSSGGVGAAASFFSGSFDANEVASNHGQGNSSAYTTRPTRPNSNYHSSSAPIIPTIGGYTLGTAAGYTIGNQSVSHHQWSDHEPSIAGAHIENSESTQAPSPSGPPISYYPNEVRPLKPGKQSAQSFTYAAGAAGLATAAYEHGGHATSQDSSTFQRPTTQNPATTMAYRHRHHGPLDAFVNFFKDPEGVAQFEEYSELIGVCRYCFAPGSSSRDAPRKHYHKGRHSNERHSSSARIDKDSRYYSSENEGRRKKNQSWLATGLAGYGLAKVGKSLFNQKNDFDDTSSASRGRYLPDGNSRIDRRRNRSKDGVKTGVTSGGKVFRKNPAEDFFEGRTATTYSTKHRSRSRSGSRDRKASLTKAALGKAIDSSIVTSSTRGRNRTPKGAFIKIRHRSQERSPERGLKTHGRKKDRGFLNFNNGSSSSSSENLPHTASRDKLRSSKRSKAKSKDDQKAEAALVGLGAAAAALALKASHQGHKKHRLKEPGGAKETRDRRDHSSGHAYRNKKSAASPDEEIWESAPEDDTESIDSGLAYGAPARRGSRASVSSESSGTNKWGWRWGSKKKQRERPPRRNPSDHSNFPDNAGVTGAGLASSVTMSAGRYQENDMDSTSSLHLQRVFAVPTSDPSRFDVKKEGSATSSSHQVVYSRPEAVPIQHPQPITPVSASICSAHAPYEHSYTAPTVLHVFSQASYHNEIATSGAGNNMREASIPIGQETNDMTRELKLHRKDTPPASFGTDSLVGSTIPSRRVLPRDDSSTVRFDLTEEQEGRERRERRRRKKEDKKCGEIEVERQIEEEHRTSGGKSNERPLVKSNPEENPERSSANSWSGPVAVGVIGASIGAAAVTERPRFEELREERRERRRREREREDEEEALIKSERRRRQRERDVYDAIEGEFHAYPGEVSDIPEDEGRQGRPQSKQRMSVWQAAANAKRSSGHEDYGSFFRPHEFLNRTDDQVKVTSANADADIEFDQSPAIITVEPKRVRDLSTSPTYSPTDTDDTDDKVDPSQRTFPWQVPRLRLIKPTPPSTRESTPIIHPRDADDEDKEEPRDGSSQSKVKWGDDESQEYTVIYRKEDREELNELPVDEADLSGHIDEPDLPDQETTQENSSKTSVTDNDLVSYGENIAFAATLAASAEDAGFDASIVIDDPAYRRRDSPPEPVELSMPGGFDDQDEPKLSKKNRKKMKRVISRRSRDGSANGRDHEADVQDINQVEESESQASTEAQNRDFDDEGKRVKEKYPEPEEDFFETSQFAAKGAVSEIQEKYESPTEEAGSNTSSAAIINDGETSRRFSMNARVDNAGSDIVVSAVSPASTIEAGNGSSSNPDEKRKGSLWDRVLSNSAESLAEENNGRDVTFEQTLADIEEQKLEGKKSKRTSTRDEVDEYGTTGRLSATRDAEREQSCSGGNTPEESGRISQDLPAKVQEYSRSATVVEWGVGNHYLHKDRGYGDTQEMQSQSFLDTHPEPPPPPDIEFENHKPLDLSSKQNPMTPPSTEHDVQTPQYSEIQESAPAQGTRPPPSSPTAVPFHFHRPGRSASTARSLSQMPSSSTYTVPDLPPKQKPRSRSTDFKFSKEFSPFWVVEGHRSHQGQIVDEAYPSLPPSHTTSGNSSVHDFEAHERDGTGDNEMAEAYQGPLGDDNRLVITTSSEAMPPDSCNSQRTTPIARNFPPPETSQETMSLPTSRHTSPKTIVKESASEVSSILESLIPEGLTEGFAVIALDSATQYNELSKERLFQDESQQFQQVLDDMAPEGDITPENGMAPESDMIPEGAVVPEGDMVSKTDMILESAMVPENDVILGGDMAPGGDLEAGFEDADEKSKRFKRQEIDQTHTPSADTAPRSESAAPDALDPGEVQRLQEKNTQDAVDSWLPSVSMSIIGKRNNTGEFHRALTKAELPMNANKDPPADLEVPKQTEAHEQDSLTRDISRDQIVDIMTSVTQDVSNDEIDSSRSLNTLTGERLESQLERNQCKPKGKKERKALSRDNFSPLSSPVSQVVIFVGPFSEQVTEDSWHPTKPAILSREDHNHYEQRETVVSNASEVSPEAIPLPSDDDDLLDEHPKILIHSDQRKIVISIASEVFPETIPLPNDDDDLLDEHPEVPIHSEQQKIAESIASEVFPETIPLPGGDDDLHLLDEHPEIPVHSEQQKIAESIAFEPEAIPLPSGDDDLHLLDGHPEVFIHSEQQKIAESIAFEPEAIPLPSGDDDLHLLDEHPEVFVHSEQQKIAESIASEPEAIPLPSGDDDLHLLDEHPEVSVHSEQQKIAESIASEPEAIPLPNGDDDLQMLDEHPEVFIHSEQQKIAKSISSEIFPETIPLPNEDDDLLDEQPENFSHFDPSDDYDFLDEQPEVLIHSDQRKTAFEVFPEAIPLPNDDDMLDEHLETFGHSEQQKIAKSIASEVFPEAIPLPNDDDMLGEHLETPIHFEPNDDDNLLDEQPEVLIHSDQRKTAFEVFPEAIPLPNDDDMLDEHLETPGHSEQQKIAKSIASEVFPEAIPLPNDDDMLGEHPETPIHFDPSDDDNLLDEHSEVPIHSDQRKSAGSIALEVFPEAIPLPNADEMLDGHLETSINFEPSDNDNLLDEHPEVPIRSDQRKSAGSIAVEVFPEAIPLPSDDDNLLDEHFPISVLIGQPGSIGDAFREDSAGAHVQERPSVATEPYNRSQNRPIQTEQDDVDDFLAASSKKKSKKSRKSRKGSAAETSKSTEAGEEIASQPLVTPGAVEDEKRNIALDESTKAASRVESAGVEDDLVGLSNKKKGKKGKKQILKIKDLELDGRKLEQTEPPSVPIETPEAAGADTSSSIATSKAVEHEQGTKQIVEPEFGAFQKDSDVVEDEWSGFSTKRKDKKGKKQKSKTLDLDQEREESDKFQAHAVLRDEANHPLSEALTNASPVSAVLGLNKPYASFTKDSKEEFADDNNAEHGQQEPLGDQHPSIDGISVVKEPESSTLEIKPKTADPYETSDSFPSSAATTDTARDVQVIIADKNAKQSYTQHGVEAVMAPLATEDRSADKPTKEEESELGPLKLKRRGKKQKQGKTPTLSESTVNDSAKHVEVGTPLEPQPAFEAVENLLPRNSERDKKSKKKDVSETANESRDAVDLNGSVAAALQEDNDTSSMGREIISSANTAVSGGGEAFVSQQNISATNAHESDDLRRSPPDQELDAILSRTKKQKKKSKKSKAFSLNDDIVPVPDGQPIVGNREIEGGEFGQATASKNVIEESGNVADNDIGSDKDTKKSKKSKPSSLADEVASIREDEPAIVGRDVENKASEHTLPSDDTVKEPGPTIDYRIQNKKDRKKAKKERLLQWENEHIAEGETTRELGETTSENATISSADPDIVQEERTPSLQEPSDSSRTAALFETALFNATSPAAFLEQRTSIPDYPRFGQEQVSRIDVVNNSGANVVSAYGLEKNKKEKKKAKKAKKAQISTWDEGQIPQESKAGAEELSAAENNTDEPLIISIPQDLEGGPKQQRSTEEIEPTEVVRPGDWPQKVYEHERNDPYREPGESGDAQIRSVDDEQMEGSKSFNDNYENERSTKEIFSTFEFEKNKAVVEEGIAQVTSYGPGDDRPSSQQCRADDIQVPGVNQVSVGHPTSVLDLEHISPHVNTSVVARVKEKATDEFRDIQMRKGGNETSHRKEPWGDEPEFLDSASRADSDPSQGTIEVAPLSEPTTQVSASGNAETKNLFPAVEVEMLDAQEQREYNDEYAKELKRQLSPMQRGDDANLLREETDPSMFTQQNIEATIAPQLNDEHRSFARAPDLEDIIEESRSGPGSVQEIPVSRGDDSSTSKPTKKSKKSKKAKEQQPTAWEDDTATPPLVEKHERDVNTFLDPSAVTRSWDDEAPAQPLNLKEPIEQRTVEAKSSTSLRKGFTITTDGESPTRKPESEDRFGIRLRTGAKEDVGRTLEDEHQCSFVTESPHFTTDQPSIPGMWAEPADDTKDHKKQDSSHDERFKPDPADYQDRSNTESLPVKEQAVEDVVLAPTKKSKKGKKSKIKDSIRQPNPQVLGWEEDVDQSRSAEIPTAGPTVEALPEMPPSRELSPRPTPHLEDERFSSAKVPPASAPMSTSMEEGFAAAAGLVSLEADGLAKRSFKKGAKKSKKAAKISTATVLKDNTLERGNAPHEEDISNESEEQRLPLKHGGGVGAGQQFHESAPQSPPSPGYEVIKDRPKIQNQDQPLQSSQDRYSAIHASDSPVISEETSVHRAIRDSGYPETEASHTANEELPGEPSRHEQDDNFHQLVEHPEKRLNWDDESHENPRSTSRNEVNISAGVQSSSNVSTTTPNERSQRSRRRSGAAYDSDDSADSGFDVQRRRRRQAKVGETREPSPVSLTTKDRSPALFDSSPSAMVEAVDRPQDDERPSYESRREEPTWSFGHEDVPGEETADTLKGDEFNEARGLAAYSESTSNYEGTRESLFGGPESYDDAMVSPPRSPFGSESLGHQRLNTISEENLELHKKDMHNASAGSPDLGIKVEQMQSPPDTKDTVKGCISTDDLISRQAWPAVEKDRQWVDIERSRGGKADHSSSIQSFRARQGEGEVGQRAASRVSMQSETRDRDNSIHAIIRTPEQVRSASGQSYRSSGTPPLRRVDRSASGDLRGASKKSEAKSRAKIKTFSDNEAEAEDHISIASSSTYDPVTVTDKGKSRADMANVYEGWGDVRGQSPISPTRPPSMRKRQSMQLLDLETRVDQLVSENRLLQSQKSTAERILQDQAQDHSQQRHAFEEAIQEYKNFLTQKDSELNQLRQIIEQLHDQAAHLTQVNEELASSRGINEDLSQRCGQLETEHAHTHKQLQKSTRELDDLREKHTQLSTGMEDIVRREVNVALEEKDVELRQLKDELEIAKEQVRNLQQQLLTSRNREDFVDRDEDYFDGQCQSLCQHVQQWVLRFSKFSDMKACYLASEIGDEKIADRMENAILDGSDVDDYLSDRVKRRDVFMSVVMTMIWEFIFTRYLFGMDREQRQKLKNLEKILQEVGPMSAVHKWRATTLALLMKRESFEIQRATDAEAVLHEIYDTLSTCLPPPSQLVGQIKDSLRKVINAAIDLSIEMRTQRAEYSMLPPLQPEYDTNGDLARKVYFSALTMNERSGATSSNEALQEQHAVVRMVLFPLVVKNEDGDEQIVVCPAQVLTAAGSKGKKTVRLRSGQEGRSEASFAGSDVRMGGSLM